MDPNNQSVRPHTSKKTVAIASDFTSLVRVMASLMNSKRGELRVVGMDCEFFPHTKDVPKPALLQLANSNKYCALFQLGVMHTLQEKEWEESVYARIGMTPYNLALVNVADDSDLEDLDLDLEDLEESLYIRFRPTFDHILKEILEDGTILKVGVNVMEDAEYLEKHYGITCRGCLDIRYLAEELKLKAGGLSLNDLSEEVLGEKKLHVKKKVPWDSEDLPEKQVDYAATDALLGLLIFLSLNDRKITQKYDYLTRINWDDKEYWTRSVSLWTKYIGEKYCKNKLGPKPTNEWTTTLPLKGLKRNVVYESAFHVQVRNHCIVCGEDGEEPYSTRPMNIIPVDYNVPYIDGFDHCQYLCLDCLKTWQDDVYIIREELTNNCGAPWPDYDDDKLLVAKEKAEKILFDKSHRQSKQQLREELCGLLGITVTKTVDNTLDSHSLLTILSMDCWIESEHGEFVREYFVRKYNKNGNERLRFLLCHRFIQKMKPRYLPESWRSYHHQHIDFLVWDMCVISD